MATEVGLMTRLISGYGKQKEVNGENNPITRDLLGGCPVMDAKDLDLGLGVGSGSTRDKSLDMRPGKMYLRSNSSTNNNPLQDLNLPPTAISLQIPESSPKASYPAASSQMNYQSVCTIEKVKFALERMGREPQSKSQAQSEGSPSPSSSSITSNSPIKRQIDLVDGCDSSAPVAGASMMAAACPKCLLYVLISKENPRCPQCNSHVPPAVLGKNSSNKKPRINLNSTTLNLF